MITELDSIKVIAIAGDPGLNPWGFNGAPWALIRHSGCHGTVWVAWSWRAGPLGKENNYGRSPQLVGKSTRCIYNIYIYTCVSMGLCKMVIPPPSYFSHLPEIMGRSTKPKHQLVGVIFWGRDYFAWYSQLGDFPTKRAGDQSTGPQLNAANL